MVEPSASPPWLRAGSLSWVDLSGEFCGVAARRLGRLSHPSLATIASTRTWSDAVHSQQMLKTLREAGITAIGVHFDDGFGLDTQASDLEHTRAFVSACRDLGFRVFASIEAGALFYETLLDSYSDLASWAQRDSNGAIRPAPRGLPAWLPCYTNPAFLSSLQRSIHAVCEQLHADGVLLRNVGPHRCHCDRCREVFHQMLRVRYADPFATFGLPTFDHVCLPAKLRLSDPLCFEAARFELHVLKNALVQLRAFLRTLTPHAALWVEPRLHSPLANSLTAHWELCAGTDIQTFPIHSQLPNSMAAVHVYAIGRGTSTLICIKNAACGPELAIACGGHPLTFSGILHGTSSDAFLSGSLLPAVLVNANMQTALARILGFAARHEHYHYQAQSIAEVALIFSAADLLSKRDDLEALIYVESALVNLGVPFDVLPIEKAQGAPYSLFVMAGQSRLTEEEISIVRGCIQKGVGLLVVGNAGRMDEFGRPRIPEPLADLVREGRARQVAEPSDAKWSIRFMAAISSLLPQPPVVEVLAPPHTPRPVFVHPYRLPTGQAAFHLVNMGERTIEGLRLRVRADLAPTRHVAWHEPDTSDCLLDPTLDGDRLVAALPPLHDYALAVTS
ncbi:MAG: hypothetical protein ACUVX8_03075 [Candidatus Zipacnadales bacterium]